MTLLQEFFVTNPNSSSCFNLSDLLDHVLNAPQQALPEVDNRIQSLKISRLSGDAGILDFADRFLNNHLRYLCEKAEPAGEFRARYFLKKTISDKKPLPRLDFIVTPKGFGKNPKSIYQTPFIHFLECFNIMNLGKITNVTPKFSAAIGHRYFAFPFAPGNIRIWFVNLEQFGIAQLLTTSSKRHIDRLSILARSRNAVLMPQGLFTCDHKVFSRTEEEIYESLGLPYIPPEKRFRNLENHE